MKPVNGLTSWHETHFEIVSEINSRLVDSNVYTSNVHKYREQHGTSAMYGLAEDLTDKFERKFENFEWDGEFIDEIEKFCIEELDKNL